MKIINETISQPHAALVGGLVFGVQESLGADVLENFRTVGLIHIIVLSGYNITIVAEALMRFFAFLPQRVRFLLGASAMVLFAILVGGGATVVRATIMALLVIIARVVGRRHTITRALFLAGFLMLLFNPRILVSDPSFQLSFLATCGLIYAAPYVERFLGFLPSRLQVREFATATISTQIFVLPLLLVYMGSVSLVAVPVNILVLVVVPVVMLLGFLTGVFGLVYTALGLPFAYLSYVFLEYIFRVVDMASRVPFADVSVSHFSVWAAVGMYVVYGVVLWFLKRKQPSSQERRLSSFGV